MLCHCVGQPHCRMLAPRMPARRLQGAVGQRSRPAMARPGNRRSLRVQALEMSPNYGYVLGSVAFSAGLAYWQAIRVALARRECGVNYPDVYAKGNDEKALRFNCTQRSHQNTLETLPAMIVMEAILGLQSPILAASLGMVWNAGRIVYTLGYSTGDPSQRMPGAILSGLTYFAMVAATGYTGIKMTGLLP